ncbi:methyl-accepting chemotaxis protein [Hydrogenophaga soli]
MLSGWTIKTKLVLLSTLLLTFFALSGLTSVYLLQDGDDDMSSLYADRLIPLKQLKAVSDAYAVQIVDTAHKARDGALSAEQAARSIAEAKDIIQREWKAYTATFLVEEEKLLVSQMNALMVPANAAVDELARLVTQADKAVLAAFAARQMYPAFDPMQDVLGKLIQVQLDVSQHTVQAHQHSTRAFTATLVVTLLVAGAVGLGVALWISRSTVEPLRDAVQFAHQVAQGDLTANVDAPGSDEVAQLRHALREMQDALAHVVAQVRQQADQLAEAAQEIAGGNLDLSQRTEEQASALQQQAASMEQLGAAVHHNAHHADQASRMAAHASEVAIRGGEVVAEVVSTMQGITASSRKIGDIIGVIDGIAFQTNILALNAAVEAARAGDAGRGFAVVATEVRNLASRSASAAQEIKALIHDSLARVESGSQQVDAAGHTMGEVVEAIHKVTQLVNDIDGASNQQSTGMDQVGKAITQIDQATQMNAALVEEMAAATERLKAQAQELVTAVSVFQLRGG